MYYLMQQKYTDKTVEIYPRSHFEYSLSMGKRMPDHFPVPLEYEINTELPDYQDDSDESECDEADTMKQRVDNKEMPTTFLPEPIFSADFVEALRAAGVDTIDVYPVIISNPETGEQFTNYRGVNIIGLVSCTDVKGSEYEELAHSLVFRRLVIDANCAQGFDIFRLAECDEEILVSDKVVKSLPHNKFSDVIFKPVHTS